MQEQAAAAAAGWRREGAEATGCRSLIVQQSRLKSEACTIHRGGGHRVVTAAAWHNSKAPVVAQVTLHTGGPIH